MTRDEKEKDYLMRAKEADEMAQKASSPTVRDTWLKIAKNYRDLADFGQGKSRT